MRRMSPKKQSEIILCEAESIVWELYRRMRSHIQFEFTEQMAFDTLVRPEDADFVRHSEALYGHLRSNYYGSPSMEIVGRTYDPIVLAYNRKTSWVPPRYLQGKQSAETISPAFFEAIQPWLEQIAPLREMYRTTQSAIFELRTLCSDEMSRIHPLWPAIEVLAKVRDRSIPKLPKAKGLPSPSPELREKLNIAQTFINSALMMPDAPMAEPVLRLSLGGSNWR